MRALLLLKSCIIAKGDERYFYFRVCCGKLWSEETRMETRFLFPSLCTMSVSHNGQGFFDVCEVIGSAVPHSMVLKNLSWEEKRRGGGGEKRVFMLSNRWKGEKNGESIWDSFSASRLYPYNKRFFFFVCVCVCAVVCRFISTTEPPNGEETASMNGGGGGEKEHCDT